MSRQTCNNVFNGRLGFSFTVTTFYYCEKVLIIGRLHFINGKCHIKQLKSCKTCLTIHTRSIRHHNMPLVINALEGTHTRTHACTHTHIHTHTHAHARTHTHTEARTHTTAWTKAILRNQACTGLYSWYIPSFKMLNHQSIVHEINGFYRRLC